MTRVFSHGGLRLFILKLLDEQPRYGYELIRLVEDHFLGMYTPSAGTIYPRLSALEADGLIEHDEVEGRKVYRLTDAGRAELQARQADLQDLQNRAVESARQLANEIRDEVRTSVRDFRSEIKQAMRDVRREERRGDRHGRGRVDWEERSGTGAESNGDKLAWRSLKADLAAFADDVLAAARQQHLDSARVRAIRDILMDARESVVNALQQT